jgi:hypothetical protein
MSEIKSSSSSQVFPLLSVDGIKKDLETATGSNQLTPGEGYWGDQYNVISTKKEMKKRNNKDILALGIGNDTFDSVQRKKSLSVMLEGSSQCFSEAVGWIHLLFLRVDIYCSLVWSCKHILKKMYPKWEPAAWTNEKAIVQVDAENYEVPLGGLDWGAYDVFYLMLIPLLKGEETWFSPEYISTKFVKQLDAAGMNSAKHKEIYESALMVRDCIFLTKDVKTRQSIVLPENFALEDAENFLLVCTEILFRISKAQLEVSSASREDVLTKLNPHDSMVLAFEYFMDNISERDREKLLNSSTVVRQIQTYCTTMYRAMKKEPAKVSKSFLEIKRSRRGQ